VSELSRTLRSRLLRGTPFLTLFLRRALSAFFPFLSVKRRRPTLSRFFFHVHSVSAFHNLVSAWSVMFALDLWGKQSVSKIFFLLRILIYFILTHLVRV